jgi:hypothetical protein
MLRPYKDCDWMAIAFFCGWAIAFFGSWAIAFDLLIR